MTLKNLFCTFLVLLVLSPILALSQCWPEVGKLVPDKAFDKSEGLGKSLDFKDDIAAIGAPDSDTLKPGSGVVYVFQFNGSIWKKIASLAPSDPRQSQNFGQRLMMVGDDIYVSDVNHTEAGKQTGLIYIFKKPVSGWHDMNETSTLKAADPSVLSFGRAMDAFENTLIVGASISFSGSTLTDRDGVALVFELQAGVWTQIATFSSGRASPSIFGSNVAIRKNLAVVVAEEEQISSGGYGIGASYVFEKENSASWADAIPVARLTRSSTAEYISDLGRGIAIDESRETVFIGDNFYDDGTYGKGFRSYVKPPAGWSNMTESAQYINYDPSQLYYGRLLFDEPYVYFIGGRSVNVFKPDQADSWNNLISSTSLINDSNHMGQQLGFGLSAKNGRVLVGAPAENTYDRDQLIKIESPAVYEFIMPSAGWSDPLYNENNKIVYEPKTAANFTFGNDVDIDGDFAVVGAPRDDESGQQSGAAYVFHLEKGIWKKVAKLLPSDGEPLDYFGGRVAISKDYIVITAVNKHYRDQTGKVIDFNLGAVYIFKKPSGQWIDATETYKLVKTENLLDYTDTDSRDDYFGTDIDIEFPYLVVTRFQQNQRPNIGSAFVYNLSGNEDPILEATLNPSTTEGVNNFGTSVKMANNVIVVSSGGLRTWFIETNRVFVYVKQGDKWADSMESAILYPSDAEPGGYLNGIAFGTSVDMNASGTRIIVGAPGWHGSSGGLDPAGLFKGAAYIYEMPAGGWVGTISEKASLTNPDQPAYGCMGVAVHIEDRYAVVGSPQNYIYTYGGNLAGPGRVFFYQMPEEGWKYKTPDKIIMGAEAQQADSDYFGASLDGVLGYLMIGATSDDNQDNVDVGSVYVYTEYPFVNPVETPLCVNGEPVELSGYPAGGQWSGTGITSVTAGTFAPAVSKAGTFQIHYRVDDCDASNSLRIEVKEVPEPFEALDRDSVYFCGAREVSLQATKNKQFTVQWTYSKNDSDYSLLPQATLPVLKADKEGFYKATVANVCSTEEGKVWVGDLYPEGGDDFEICLGAEVVQLKGNYDSGVWLGQYITSEKYFTSAPAGVGKHNIYYSVSPYEGCAYVDTVMVTVKSIPTIDISAKDVNRFCYTGSTQLTATPLSGVTYQWYYGKSKSDLDLTTVTSNLLNAHDVGTFRVVAFDGQCTEDAFYTFAPVFEPKITSVFDSASFCATTPIKINAEDIDGATYIWSRSMNDITEVKETTNSFATEINESGKYFLEIKSFGCAYKSQVMTAHKIRADSVFVPNVITPNGDHINDSVEIFVSEGIGSYSFMVFNRSGSELYRYQGSSRNTGWTGGQLPAGVYFWFLDYAGGCPSGDKNKGAITILR